MSVHPLPDLPASPERELRLRSLATVKPEPIRWLVPGLIPFGAISVLAGRPGQGKSTLGLAIAARLSHDAGVLLVGEEDGLADTVVPRLLAARANTGNVHAVDVVTDRGFEDAPILPSDVPLLERKVKEAGASMVIIDPLAAHLDPEMNSMSDHSLRQATRPLARMAHDTGCAVLIIAHLRKSRDGGPMDWVGGSGGLVGAARSVMLFGRRRVEREDVWADDDERFLVPVKLNGGRLAKTVRCRVEQVPVEQADRVVWTSRILYEADDPRVDAYDLE